MQANQNSGQVSRLKELLFEDEQRAIADVRKRLQDHHKQIGTSENLQKSVSKIIASALKEAEVEQHRELSAAISPLVVAGIKREIANSREEMVDALYPILGRLVSAYVNHSIREIIDGANSRLENRFSMRALRLRLKSLISSRSYAELALAYEDQFQVREILLIKRGSGKLLDYWEAEPDVASQDADNTRSLVGGLLAAITEFAEEAFAEGTEAFRTLDVGTGRIYLRASPAYLLALRCVGPETAKLRNQLDEILLEALRDNSELSPSSEGFEQRRSEILPALAERVLKLEKDARKPPIMALSLLAIIFACALAWVGWSYLQDYRTAQLEASIRQSITEIQELAGFPIQVDIAADRSKVSLSGLVPSAQIGTELQSAVGGAIDPIPLESNIATVLTPPSLQEASETIQRLAQQTELLDSALINMASSANLEAASSKLDAVIERLDDADRALSLAGEQREDLVQRLEGLANEMSRAVAKQTDRDRQNADTMADLRAIVSGKADDLSLKSSQQQINELQLTLKRAEEKIAEINDRRKMREIIQSTLIFFDTGTRYLSPEMAREALMKIGELVSSSDLTLRIIGYTDQIGGPTANQKMAMQRALHVKNELVAIGVADDRMIPLGRPEAPDLISEDPELNSNRRVEFEIAFE